MNTIDLYQTKPKLIRITNQLLQFYNDDNWLENTSYLLLDDNYGLVIDPSFLGDYLVRFCQKHKIIIKAILLTHGHWDHWINAKSLVEYAKVPIYCHLKDQVVVESAWKSIKRIDPHFQSDDLAIEAIEFHDWKDHDVIKINNFQLGVLHTPGHTPGSVCFSVEDYVFSGDHVFADSIGRTDLEHNQAELMDHSLKKFFDHYDRNQTVLPGHLDFKVRVCDVYHNLKKMKIIH
ncbi:Metallo-Beta-Lactamase Glyoxalase II [[Mycoplasma] cavipharyngis]|uniref:MBL fold metallo-hydrolase n=1 Tax=[Mycoplasma] cavipharyngis TaxID=92757 RepID=UPI003703D97D